MIQISKSSRWWASRFGGVYSTPTNFTASYSSSQWNNEEPPCIIHITHGVSLAVIHSSFSLICNFNKFILQRIMFKQFREFLIKSLILSFELFLLRIRTKLMGIFIIFSTNFFIGTVATIIYMRQKLFISSLVECIRRIECVEPVTFNKQSKTLHVDTISCFVFFQEFKSPV